MLCLSTSRLLVIFLKCSSYVTKGLKGLKMTILNSGLSPLGFLSGTAQRFGSTILKRRMASGIDLIWIRSGNLLILPGGFHKDSRLECAR